MNCFAEDADGFTVYVQLNVAYATITVAYLANLVTCSVSKLTDTLPSNVRVALGLLLC